jgi:iron(III) transport system permease protein
MNAVAASHSPSHVPWSVRWKSTWLSAWALLIGALVALPVLAVISHVLSTGTSDTWRTWPPPCCPTTSAPRCGCAPGVGWASRLLGVGAAWLVTRYSFPAARRLEWALVLPLAVPAYVMAYTYTDLLQFVGPGADRAARNLRLEARRLLVPRRAHWAARW